MEDLNQASASVRLPVRHFYACSERLGSAVVGGSDSTEHEKCVSQPAPGTARLAISRRAVAFRSHIALVLGLIMTFCVVLAAPSRASEDPARFVQALGHKAIEMLSDGSQTPADRERVFRNLLTEHFDIKKIGRLVMGRHWRNVSDPQKAEFSELFENFIVATYANRLSDYNGEQFTVGTARQNGKRTTAVASQIKRPDGAPIGIDWMLQQEGNRWYVIDVVIEGISMVITQRAEFGTVISQRGGVDGLLEALRRKTAAAGRS